MRRLRFLFLGLASLTFGAATELACSSDDSSATDAGIDASAGDATSGGDATSSDAGSDVVTPIDAGSCPGLAGECDLTKQDCTPGKECSVVVSNGKLATACVTAGTGNKPIGASCVPGQANQCIPGLECVGGGADAGATGRCSPYCCPGNDTPCGSSIPEGFRGTCDTQLVTDFDGGTVVLGDVCTYKGVCQPFQLQACPPNYACLLQGDGVSFRCTGVFNPPGKDAGVACTASNDCADGMECLGPADGGSTCRIMCARPDGGAPFDAGALSDAGAGKGGCPVSKACNGVFTGAPDWYGFCVP